MLTTIVLVCSLISTPNLRDCSRDNAVDVLLAEPAQNPTMCGLLGQIQLAQLTDFIRPNEAMKVLCARRDNASR